MPTIASGTLLGSSIPECSGYLAWRLRFVVHVLIIGGTRFVGPHVVHALLEQGHRVTTFNRGRTPDQFPRVVERLRGDRTEPGVLARAVGRRSFDAAIDMIAMRGSDTWAAITALGGRVGRFVHISTGQVYLVRESCPAPAREEDYVGPLRSPPPPDSWEFSEWRYGVEKRQCEDALEEAWSARAFPAVRLRMPIIHGRRDPSGRLAGYVKRAAAGESILVPREAGPPLRHVHAADVTDAILRALGSSGAAGRAYNVAADDLWSHERFLARVGELVGVEPRLETRPRAELEGAGLFPACAPFTSPWMSVLDNTRSVTELDLHPSGFDEFLPALVHEHLASL